VYGPVLPGVVPRERIVDTTTPNTVGPRFAVADFLEDGRSTVVVSDSFRGQAAPWWLDPGGGREPEALDLFVFTQVEVGQLDGDGGRNDLVTVTSAPSDPTYRDVEVASFEGGSHRVLGRYRATAVIDAAILFDLDQDGVDEVLVSTAGDSAEITWATAPAGELPLEEVGLGSWQADLSVGTIARMVPAGDHNGDGYADLMVVPFRLGEVWLVHGGDSRRSARGRPCFGPTPPRSGRGYPTGRTSIATGSPTCGSAGTHPLRPCSGRWRARSRWVAPPRASRLPSATPTGTGARTCGWRGTSTRRCRGRARRSCSTSARRIGRVQPTAIAARHLRDREAAVPPRAHPRRRRHVHQHQVIRADGAAQITERERVAAHERAPVELGVQQPPRRRRGALRGGPRSAGSVRDALQAASNNAPTQALREYGDVGWK
jgi:hypothetical protein